MPAGKYGKAALTALGMWASVQTARRRRRLRARGAEFRRARGEAPLGIVYRSDAVSEPTVRASSRHLPAGSHEPIVYPLALIRRPCVGRREETARAAAHAGGARGVREVWLRDDRSEPVNKADAGQRRRPQTQGFDGFLRYCSIRSPHAPNRRSVLQSLEPRFFFLRAHHAPALLLAEHAGCFSKAPTRLRSA